MKKNFNIILPDEPFKSSTDLGNTVQCTYEGPRFVIARSENTSNKIQNAVAAFDKLEDINLENYFEEGHTFFVIDAVENPFEAAYVTNSYTNGDVDNYKETLPTGEEWEFNYDNGTGVISQVYNPFDLGYDEETKKFIEPSRPTHSLTRESFFEGFKNFIARIEESLKINDYTAEERTKLENHKAWLENIETTYANVDHWKIPYPTDLPPF